MVKLDSTIVSLDFYPKGRAFTEFEAFIDFQLNQQVPRDVLPERWGWTPSEVIAFFGAYKHELTGKKYQRKDDSVDEAFAQQVCDLFKEVTGHRASLNPARLKMISARVREGKNMKVPIGIDQFKAVFEFKNKQWANDPKMKKYLRIKTLCDAENFLEYLEEARAAYLAQIQQNKVQEKGIVLETKAFR